HLIRLCMPLTSTIDSTTVPLSMSSGNVLRHTRWIVSQSLYRDRSEACFQATSGGSGTSIDPESFAMRSVLLVAALCRGLGRLLGLLLHLVDGVGVLALRLVVDELARLVDRHLDLVGVLRQQIFCFVQESHVVVPSPRIPRNPTGWPPAARATTAAARRASWPGSTTPPRSRRRPILRSPARSRSPPHPTGRAGTSPAPAGC